MKTNFLKSLLLALIAAMLPQLASAYDFMVDGIYYNITSLQDLTVEVTYGESEYGTYSGDIILNETVVFQNREFTVTRLGDYAFYSCYDLTSIEIPSTVTTAGDHVFSSCSSLTSLTIPTSMIQIGSGDYWSGCFSGCYSLSNLIFEDSENYLALSPNDWYANSNSTFKGCPLKSVYIGRNIYMFHCSEENDNPLSNREQLKDVVFGECVNETPIFYGCTGLETINIPGNVTLISLGTFKNCSNLSQVNMSEGVSQIDQNAFDNCTAIKTITFPSTIQWIGNNAFLKCTGITIVNAKMETPPSIAENAFPGLVYLNAPLRVPVGTKSLYENASGWKNFSTIEEVDSFEEEDIFYRVSLQVSDGGVVSLNDNNISNSIYITNVKEGENLTLSFAPNEGNNLSSVFVNDVDLIDHVQNNSLTIENIQQETIVKVTFTHKENIYGDVNGDGVVNVADVTEIYNILLGD